MVGGGGGDLAGGRAPDRRIRGGEGDDRLFLLNSGGSYGGRMAS